MFSWLEPRRRPIIVGHRGSSSTAPENTIASFNQAFDDGADAVECDVRLTRDERAVVIHDETLQRTAGIRGLVGEHALAELRQLSAGRWFNKRFAGERVPTLEETLELITPSRGINIEIKTGRLDPGGERTLNRCLRIIFRHRAQDRVLITSFSERAVRNAAQARPRIAAGLLYHPLRHRMKRPVRFACDLGARYIVMNGSTLRRRYVEEAHGRDILVGEYTVNSSWRWRRALRYGVDAVISDSPCGLPEPRTAR